jgi:hypothetical protein
MELKHAFRPNESRPASLLPSELGPESGSGFREVREVPLSVRCSGPFELVLSGALKLCALLVPSASGFVCTQATCYTCAFLFVLRALKLPAILVPFVQFLGFGRFSSREFLQIEIAGLL